MIRSAWKRDESEALDVGELLSLKGILDSRGSRPGLDSTTTLSIQAIETLSAMPLGRAFRYPGGRHDSILKER
jgi:hypothetical protein